MPTKYLPFFNRIHQEGKPYFILFNKADPATTRKEILLFFQSRGMKIPEDRLCLVPYMQSPSIESISNQHEFSNFTSLFFQETDKDKFPRLLRNGEAGSAQILRDNIDLLIDLLEDENTAGQKWMAELDSLLKTAAGIYPHRQRPTMRKRAATIYRMRSEKSSVSTICLQDRGVISQDYFSCLFGFWASEKRNPRNPTEKNF